jgi:RNA polymerase sigma factor (sigma-70 family)
MPDINPAPYLDQVKRTRLSKAEVTALIRRIRRGDRRAHEQLVRSHLHFVPYALRGLIKNSADPEAVVQDGNLGLMRAIEKFKPERGFAFATYAIRWILSVAGREERYRRSMVRHASSRSSWPHPDESLDAPIPGTDGLTHGDILPEWRDGPEGQVARTETDAETHAIVDEALDDLGRDIVWNRIASDSPDTLKEIGLRHDARVAKVSQREKLILFRLKRHLDPERQRDATA